MPTKNKRGFTLIEVLIAVAILAILTLALITSLTKQRMRAQDARMKSDLERLRIAFEEYYNDNNCYPPTTLYNDENDCGSENLKPYLNTLPCNPNTGQPYTLDYPDGQCASFKLYTTLNDTNDSSLSKFCVASGGYTNGNYGVSSTNVVIGIDCSALPTATPSLSPSLPPGFNNGIYGCQPSVCNDYMTLENATAHCTYSFAEYAECQALCDNPTYWCN